MKITRINTEGAPEAIGPYSQAIKADQLIITSGQIALDPVKGVIVAEGIEEQTEQVLKNLKAVLSASGADFSDVVETLIFCTDLKEFNKINRVYEVIMDGHKPARSTVEVSSLPKNAKIEIRMLAISRE